MNKLMSIEKSFSLLKRYSIPCAEWKLTSTVSSASKIAKKIGFPIAMKIASQKVVHKSDAGAVKIGIKNEDQLIETFEGLMTTARKKLKVKPEGIIVQKMEEGIEVIIGMKRDPQFGPVILFGLGGIFVEIMKDVSMRIAPLTKQDCFEMINEVKGIALLKGARGRKPVNLDKIVEILMSISKISEKNEKIVEMDLNPVMVKENVSKVVDVRIIIK